MPSAGGRPRPGGAGRGGRHGETETETEWNALRARVPNHLDTRTAGFRRFSWGVRRSPTDTWRPIENGWQQSNSKNPSTSTGGQRSILLLQLCFVALPHFETRATLPHTSRKLAQKACESAWNSRPCLSLPWPPAMRLQSAFSPEEATCSVAASPFKIARMVAPA